MKPDVANFARKSQSVLNTLFDQAKSKDEFEYVCALTRFPGVSQARKGLELLHVSESRKLIEDITQSFLNKEMSLYTKARLGLLLYSHILEMRDLYATLENMLNICRGKVYDHKLLYRRKKNIENHIAAINALASKAGLGQIADLFEEFYSKGIRDTFFHAEYSLEGDKYILLYGNKAKYKDKEFQELNLKSELIPILQRAINFALAYFQICEDKLRSYDKPRILEPRHPTSIRAIKIIPTSTGVTVTVLNVRE